VTSDSLDTTMGRTYFCNSALALEKNFHGVTVAIFGVLFATRRRGPHWNSRGAAMDGCGETRRRVLRCLSCLAVAKMTLSQARRARNRRSDARRPFWATRRAQSAIARAVTFRWIDQTERRLRFYGGWEGTMVESLGLRVDGRRHLMLTLNTQHSTLHISG
jgi:hypothetical protein